MRNKHFQKKKNNNPALNKIKTENIIKKYMDDSRHSGVEYGTIITSVLFAHVMYDKTHLSDEEIRNIVNEVIRASDSILGDYMTIEDAIKALKEENDFSISEDKLLEFYPSLEGYLSPKKD